MDERPFKRGDDVLCKTMPDAGKGVVLRSARDGSWVDVFWVVDMGSYIDSWSKRMRAEALMIFAAGELVNRTQTPCVDYSQAVNTQREREGRR